MGRTWALGLAVAGLVGAAGCSQSGSYRLSWVFLENGVTESSAGGCGQHGVDSILATGTDGSDSVRIIALCVPGSFTGTAPPGSWTFTLQMLDAGGFPVRPVNPPPNSNPDVKPPNALPPQPTESDGPRSIAAGAPPAEFSVRFIPPPACNDGIDNDRDGRVDNGAECDAGTPRPQDGGTSVDAAPNDGGAADGGDGGRQDGGALDGGDGGRQDAAGSPDARG